MESRTSIKLFICLLPLLIGLAYSVAAPTPTPFDASKIDYSKFTPEEIAATEAHKDQLKSQVKSNLATIVVTSDAQADTLKKTNKSLDLYDAAVKTQIDQGNAAILALPHVLTQLHRAKWIMCGLWLALCGLIAWKVGKIPILGQYSLYGVAALAVAGVTFIWLWI